GRRVSPADDDTEIGRLGLAVNTMLERIESAFAERQQTENRLRRFVADASHELRTPLTSIRGYAELFRRGAASRPDDLAKAMHRIEEEAARMGVLVEELLLLARLDQGRPLPRQPVDLSAMATEAVGDARVVEPDRPIDLDVDVDGPARVTGDATRLRQVFDNLLANVRTHTPRGTPATVRVRADGDTAVIVVEDQGPGMTDDEAARAFERFYRVDPSRARTSGGVGLGLSIVSAIVAAHDGEVRVDSVPGQGAGLGELERRRRVGGRVHDAAVELAIASVLVARDLGEVDGDGGGVDLGPGDGGVPGDRRRATDSLVVLAEQDLLYPVPRLRAGGDLPRAVERDVGRGTGGCGGAGLVLRREAEALGGLALDEVDVHVGTGDGEDRHHDDPSDEPPLPSAHACHATVLFVRRLSAILVGAAGRL